MGEVEVSVVIPCLNEEKTVGACVEGAFHTLDKMGVTGEVIVSDSSTDCSPEIARSLGARVVQHAPEGYGSAYLRGIALARGQYIVMGDADSQFDFSEITSLIEPLQDGYEMVVGNRFLGDIRPGAMPWHHRYIGTPLLTRVLNLFFHADVGDVFCGFRAFKKESYDRLKLQSTGMEFALEMLANASRVGLRITEVPVTVYPRMEGTEARLQSFRDGWRSLRFALLYSPDWLFLGPGLGLMSVGFLLLMALLPGPIQLGVIRMDIHYMVLGSLLALLGLQVISLGVYAKVYALAEHFVERDGLATRLLKWFDLERGLLLGASVFAVGLIINLFLVYRVLATGFGGQPRLREAILAMTLMIIGTQIVFSSFFLSLLGIKRKGSEQDSALSQS